jgi:hypothetical protein
MNCAIPQKTMSTTSRNLKSRTVSSLALSIYSSFTMSTEYKIMHAEQVLQSRCPRLEVLMVAMSALVCWVVMPHHLYL